MDNYPIEDKPINFLHEYRDLMRHVVPLNRKASLQEFCIGAMSVNMQEMDKVDVISLLRAEIFRTE